ncbi:MAG: ABC transporter permease [Muribaculaceae bacterium]|nr:ABC transporter permease [Muribaculaceae bacterium]
MSGLGFISGIKREIRRLTSRKIYLCAMAVVPIFICVFLLNILHEGLPEHAPTAIVDLDHSSMSRSVSRSLKSLSLIDVNHEYDSYDNALAAVRRGEIFGFFIIPANFERDALAQRKPTLEYYTNMTYFVPGSLSFKGFKTVAVTTSGGVVRETLLSAGVEPAQAAEFVQPVIIDQYPLNNPWMSYAVYLCPSFSICTLVLMIMLMTAFSITTEIKDKTSTQWLETAKGRLSVALLSKLLPHTIIFCSVALFILYLLFGYSQFPLNGSLVWLIIATILTVIAAQAFAVFVVSIFPNPRLALSVCSLFGILSFSLAGFSFPVQSMYGYLAIFSWSVPIKYWFLIYVNEALNGVALYYSRVYFVALLIFPLIALTGLWNLKRACVKPVYVP